MSKKRFKNDYTVEVTRLWTSFDRKEKPTIKSYLFIFLAIAAVPLFFWLVMQVILFLT